jgi:hypothetical protein
VWVDALAEAMEEGKKVADGLTRQYDLKSATAEECRRLEQIGRASCRERVY